MMIKTLLKNRKSGFTLVEMMISMAIFSMIMTLIMSSVHSMTIARIKNMNRLALTDQLYLFSEQLFTTIKNGGTIDYEEYWNRKTFNTDVKNWHYKEPSGVGNYGKDGIFASDFGGSFYYCRSQSTTNYLKDQWCASDWNLNDSGISQMAKMQRFGQYALQFWDYNGNKDEDKYGATTLFGDENGDGDLVGDEDDFNLWNGSEAIMSDVKELYLIDKQGKKRTFLRWNWEDDPNRQNQNISCKAQTGKFIPDDNCIANIQILKMNGSDLWLGHDGRNDGIYKGAYDGNIDTWICEEGWNCSAGKTTPILSNKKVATGKNEEWINLFPNSVTVRDFKIEVFPKKDPWLSAAAPDCDNTDTNCVSPFIHPYVRITLELGFSHGARRSLRGENPTISVSTTISLDDFR